MHGIGLCGDIYGNMKAFEDLEETRIFYSCCSLNCDPLWVVHKAISSKVFPGEDHYILRSSHADWTARVALKEGEPLLEGALLRFKKSEKLEIPNRGRNFVSALIQIGMKIDAFLKNAKFRDNKPKKIRI